MKVAVALLLCVGVAVQGRSSGVNTSSRELAGPGDNPWLVHLRLAIATSGLLQSCAGTLIDQAWVLTSAECMREARFVWIRYGTVTVINPELVTETSAVTLNPQWNPFPGNHNLALVSINRLVQSTGNISPIPLADDEDETLPETTRFCAYGAEEDNSPGEQLRCFDVDIESVGGRIVATTHDGAFTQYDSGAPLVANGRLVGILDQVEDSSRRSRQATFTKPAQYISWINSVSGLDL